MPSFNFARRLLRGPKARQMVSCDVAPAVMSPPASSPSPVPTGHFVSLLDQPGLVSLSEAQNTASIVYRSVGARKAPSVQTADELRKEEIRKLEYNVHMLTVQYSTMCRQSA